jgi:hypothetical protein
MRTERERERDIEEGASSTVPVAWCPATPPANKKDPNPEIVASSSAGVPAPMVITSPSSNPNADAISNLASPGAHGAMRVVKMASSSSGAAWFVVVFFWPVPVLDECNNINSTLW